ncbi:MAG: permease [Desulfobacteraceae bacterium]|nr:permease [Desulfobacteraceae bacterium]
MDNVIQIRAGKHMIGIPMYSGRHHFPLSRPCWKREPPLGTVLAFMMSVIALSQSEAIILRKVLKPRLVATFIGVVGAGILFVGYIFNFLT